MRMITTLPSWLATVNEREARAECAQWIAV